MRISTRSLQKKVAATDALALLLKIGVDAATDNEVAAEEVQAGGRSSVATTLAARLLDASGDGFLQAADALAADEVATSPITTMPVAHHVRSLAAGTMAELPASQNRFHLREARKSRRLHGQAVEQLRPFLTRRRKGIFQASKTS